MRGEKKGGRKEKERRRSGETREKEMEVSKEVRLVGMEG